MVKRLESYRDMGSKTLSQMTGEELHYRPEAGSNSIAVIVQHLHGNMLSRFTGFLKEDGEKESRDRDGEFVDAHIARDELVRLWDEGWACSLDAVRALRPEDLERTVTIRMEPHTVVDALERNLGHSAYHVGQIVYLGKVIRAGDWKTLSIPVGKSKEFFAAYRAKFGDKSGGRA